MNKFDIAENKGREIFLNILNKNKDIKNIKFSTKKYECFDVEYQSGETDTFIVELKYREGYNSTDSYFINEGVILEKLKYDNIISLANQKNAKAYYVMMFNDNIGYVWDLTKIKCNWIEKLYPKTTCGNNSKIKKFITFLKLNEGKKFLF